MIHPYISKPYANAFEKQFKPIFLTHTNSWILQREIPNTAHTDLIACYPRYPIISGEQLHKDFSMLQNQGSISFTFVTDVFFHPTTTYLQENCDHVNFFKTHYLHDCSKPKSLSKHHRYEVKQAKKDCTVKIVSLREHLPTWLALYNTLVERRQITGIQAFSTSYFETLTRFDHLTTMAAFDKDDAVLAMHLWFEYDGYVYSHLAAASKCGYQYRASYAIYDYVIDHYQDHRCIDFGSGAGNLDNQNDGLARFKRGFSNENKQVFLCGKILNHHVYKQLCSQHNCSVQNNYFPLYRWLS